MQVFKNLRQFVFAMLFNKFKDLLFKAFVDILINKVLSLSRNHSKANIFYDFDRLGSLILLSLLNALRINLLNISKSFVISELTCKK